MVRGEGGMCVGGSCIFLSTALIFCLFSLFEDAKACWLSVSLKTDIGLSDVMIPLLLQWLLYCAPHLGHRDLPPHNPDFYLPHHSFTTKHSVSPPSSRQRSQPTNMQHPLSPRLPNPSHSRTLPSSRRQPLPPRYPLQYWQCAKLRAYESRDKLVEFLDLHFHINSRFHAVCVPTRRLR